ncbi:MAG TPA: MFS transporter, partial [Thermomicrobiales bacterium]|nr:MFS transporter [Thermomicrobiales bacterium]
MLTSLFWRPRWPAKPIPVYLLFSGGAEMLFTLTFTLNLVYQATIVGLNPMQMVLVGTLLEVVCFVFEVPTGIVADVYSRRLSILIGVFLIGTGFIIEGSIPHFAAVLACQVFWGIGATFLSGAVEAWITDEVGDEHVGPVFLRGTQLGLIGTVLGIVGATALGWRSVQIPVVAGGVGFLLLGVVLTLVMPEHGFSRSRPKRTERGSTGRMAEMLGTFREGLGLARRRPVVGWLLAASLFLGLSSEAFDRLWTVHVLENLERPAAFGMDNVALWFGAISLVGTLFGLLGSEIVRRLHPESLHAGAPVRLLIAMATMSVLATIGFALAPVTWIALPLLWVRGVAGTIAGPVQAAWMNRHLESSVRATVLSMEGQSNAIGQIVGGPPLGYVGNR